MLRFLTLAVLICAASAITITPLPPGTVSQPGLEGAVVPCGSSGIVRSIRVSSCSALPCTLKVGDVVTVEADFSPSQKHDSLEVDVFAAKGGVDHPILSQSVPASLQPDETYTLSLQLPVTGKFGPGPLTIKISAADNGVIEVCGSALSTVEK